MKPLAQNTLIQNRYLIVQLIGKGGMGEVYLAVDQRLGSAVALKRTFFADDETLGNAFEREARILARMRHPVLPKVSDHFGEGEEQFLVMEHISGDDIAKRLELAQKPFPLQWVMFWADQLLDALSYLHSHEPPIIHRDIKPQNLKLTDDNHIILLDFGLSKNSTGNTQLTVGGSSGSTGSVVGYTPHYAPMEQIRGVGTSPQSDLYALSATLYQLLTNVVPTDALTRADALLNGSPDPIKPLSELIPEVPHGVSDVILHGMEVSQEKRFKTALEMQKALRKAYTQIADETSAKTVASTVGESVAAVGDAPRNTSFDKTEVMDFSSTKPPLSPDQSGALTSPAAETLIAPSNSANVDMDATLAFDPSAHPNMPQQSGVKTEVFSAAEMGVPSEQLAPVEDSWAENTGNSDSRMDSADGDLDFTTDKDFSSPAAMPDATMPIIAFNDKAASAGESNPYATIVGGTGGESIPSTPANAAVKSIGKPTKKKSSKKTLFVVAGFAALLIVGTIAIVAGLFIYSNYNSSVFDSEPTPSPEESIEPTPSPEFLPETVFESNSADNSDIQTADSNTSTDTNTNTDSALTAEPTPEPSQTGPVRPRQTPQIATRSTPAKKQPTLPPDVKPTPKPKKDDRTVILQ